MRCISRHPWCSSHLARRLLWLLCCLALTACATLPEPVPSQPAYALATAQAEATPLGRLTARASNDPKLSGFKLLISGEDALDTLIALADHAQKTLDLQYYLIRSDGSSRAIMRRVRAAADRGVRVRLLLDDMNTAGQDEGLMRLTRHPNIDVRLYNPLPGGRLHVATRILASLMDFKRINHRMHNKMFVADNALAVTGGRNLGDSYFLRDKDSNFLDIDVLVAGPAVRALSNTFDRFWNEPLAYPVAAVADTRASAASATGGDSASDGMDTGQVSAPTPVSASSRPVAEVRYPAFSRELDLGHLPLTWVGSRVLADRPSKMAQDAEPALDEVIYDDIDRLLLSAKRELVIISPYFVPGEHGISLFRILRDRGVVVRVLTNSLATTDAPAVHIGYARYRVPLLQMGVELSELKAKLNTPKNASIGSLGSSRASLHAKVLVIDGRVALVGSMNLDPRSSKLNTEMGVVMRSRELAGQLIQVFNEVSAESYALSLTPDHTLQWTAQPPDAALQGQQEPGASTWLKLGIKLISPLAPEEML